LVSAVVTEFCCLGQRQLSIVLELQVTIHDCRISPAIVKASGSSYSGDLRSVEPLESRRGPVAAAKERTSRTSDLLLSVEFDARISQDGANATVACGAQAETAYKYGLASLATAYWVFASVPLASLACFNSRRVRTTV
jgi:hypothetical protein